jgi:hypothetical protein
VRHDQDAAVAAATVADDVRSALLADLLDRAHSAGIRAAFVADDEMYGGRELRREIRQRGMGYVMAVRANHALTTGSGRTVTAAAGRRHDPGSRLAPDAHQLRDQWHPSPRLGDAGGDQRRHSRRAR